ncbi:hypothetical protein J3E64_002348 [Sphingobium sp. OAS761]|uniref:hypothetical protein n=1 Tax=Sphingobium sp. OAS761 TaxID=2817901 RepID=UPI0020A04ACC|nr:hypothetical protein [Sphingobium sp. OAS761]MCP1470660.1 hypothetical protein [Sphingobium sp. OAS761]
MSGAMARLKWGVAFAATAFLAGAAVSEPRQLLSVDFDDGQGMKAAGSSAIVDARSNLTFNATIDKGTKAADRPEIVTQGCHSPPRCLRISIDPSARGAAKNKIMYSFWSHYKPLPGGEPGRIRIGDNKPTTVRFSMKLDDQYDTPVHQMIHFQILQPKVSGRASKVKDVNPGGPVLSLRIVPTSRRRNKSPDVEEFIIAVRNPQAENLYYFDKRDKGVLYRGEVRKGAWNTFSFVLQSMDRRGEMVGRVGFWMNDQKKFDHSVAWGFNPAVYAVSPQMGFELGSYRSADPKGHQTVYFDDIRVDR